MKHLMKLPGILLFCLLLSVVVTATASAVPTFHSGMSQDEMKAEILVWFAQHPELKPPAHTHDNASFFTENGLIWGYCLDCGADAEIPASIPADRLIPTDIDRRTACTHQFVYHTMGKVQHRGICSLCGQLKVENHQITPANCSSHERCVRCGHHEADWDKMWGHQIDAVPNPIDDTHTLRCVRMNNDGEYICDFVETTLPCQWSNRYIDCARDGEHNIIQDCTCCFNLRIIGSYPCRYPNGCFYPH